MLPYCKQCRYAVRYLQSILGWGCFYMNYCNNAAWKGRDNLLWLSLVIPISLKQALVHQEKWEVPESCFGKENQHDHKSWQQRETLNALKSSGRWLHWPDKTQWANTSRWHDTPNHPWTLELHTEPQASNILCLTTHLPVDEVLFFRGKWQISLNLKNKGLWINEQ